MNAMGTPQASRCSTQAIWMRSSLPSVEAFGSSSNPGSSTTQRCRSVKRTVSGSMSGCASISCSAMSSASSHRSAMSEPSQRPIHHRVLDRRVHDSAGERLRLAAECIDRVTDADVILACACRLQLGRRARNALALLALQERTMGDLLHSGGMQDRVRIDPRLTQLALPDVLLGVIERLLEHPLHLLVGEAV